MLCCNTKARSAPILLKYISVAALYLCFVFLPSFSLCQPFSLPPSTLLTGLSKSFPLDNSLFESWLAKSVQITADDMLSQWALGGQHDDKSSSLLSDQVGLLSCRRLRKCCIDYFLAYSCFHCRYCKLQVDAVTK